MALVRAIVGALFFGHGTQKLFGWFGGHGVEGTGGFFESLGLAPGKRNAMAAGAAEAGRRLRQQAPAPREGQPTAPAAQRNGTTPTEQEQVAVGHA